MNILLIRSQAILQLKINILVKGVFKMKADKNKQHISNLDKKDHVKLRLMCACMIGAMAVGVVLNFAIEELKSTEEYTIENIRSDTFDYIMDE